MDYIGNADSLQLSFEYHRDSVGNEVRWWYQNNLQRIDSVDSKGRETFFAWYDLKGNPSEYENLHKRITKYEDGDGICKRTQVLINKEGNEYEKDLVFIDSVSHTRTTYTYENNDYNKGKLRYSTVNHYNSDFTVANNGEWDVTPYGEHARVGWRGALYYAMEYPRTMYGKQQSSVAHNEFDEPAYITFLDSTNPTYYYANINNGDWIYFDEYGKEIPADERETFIENLPKAYCIEVTDTVKAYPLNLRNGDIIISYGNWTTHEDLNTDLDYFYLETILQAHKPKQATLLRHNIEDKSSEIIRVTLPEGRTSDLGFYPHRIYYTQREKQRLLDTSKTYGLVFNNETMSKDTTILMAIQVKGEFNDTRFYHYPKYDIKDASLILCASKYLDSWSLTHNVASEWDKKDMLDTEGSTTTTILLTQDMTSSRVFTKSDVGNKGMIITPIQVSMDVYEQLLRCYSDCSEEVQAVEEKGKEQEFLILATVEEDEGYFVEKNYAGTYIVLEWCDWNIQQSMEDFVNEFNKKKERGKKLTLLPLDADENSLSDEILHIKTKAVSMGLRIKDLEVTSALKEEFKQIYRDWKKGKNKP